MTIAFLFKEIYPNYKLDMSILQEVANVKKGNIQSHVFSGLWYFLEKYRGQQKISNKQILEDVIDVFYGGHGNLASICVSNDFLIKTIGHNKIYVCMLSGLNRTDTIAIHARMVKNKNENYIGYTQVLPTHIKHQELFYNLIPRYKIDNNIFGVLFSDENDESSADEIIEFINTEYRSFHSFDFAQKFKKECNGYKFTIFDSNDSFEIEYQKQKAQLTMQDEYSIIFDKVVESLSEFSLDTLTELLAAIRILETTDLDATHCSQIGVSLRRCLEHLTQEVFDDITETNPGWVQKRWKAFADAEKDNTEKIRNKILLDEIKEIINMTDKVIHIAQLNNKSVHESILISYYKKILIRTTLTIDDILDIFILKRKVKVDNTLFSYEYLD